MGDDITKQINDEGERLKPGTDPAHRRKVFRDDRHAAAYMIALAKRDLQYRGMRDERIGCFERKQDANFLLYQSVRRCEDLHEYERLR